MSKNLRTFLNQVKELLPEQFKMVDKEVEPEFGVSAIIEKLENQGESPTVLFNKVKGSDIPLLINLGTSYDRLALAMDSDTKNIVSEYGKKEQNRIPVKEVSTGPVKDIILKGSDINLNILRIFLINLLILSFVNQ